MELRFTELVCLPVVKGVPRVPSVPSVPRVPSVPSVPSVPRVPSVSLEVIYFLFIELLKNPDVIISN